MQQVNAFGVGFDSLPEGLRHSNVLTGNELAQIAALVALPTREEVLELAHDSQVAAVLATPDRHDALHRMAREALNRQDVELAAKLGMLSEVL